jgi:hypothetical protein
MTVNYATPSTPTNSLEIKTQMMARRNIQEKYYSTNSSSRIQGKDVHDMHDLFTAKVVKYTARVTA